MKFTSQILAAVSGSAGGVTGSRNRYGQYLRRRAVPVNPNTALQVGVRNAMRSAVVNWSTLLTAGERAAWELYAANTTFVDALGQTQHLSGQAAYIRSAIAALYTLALSVVDPTDAPTVFDLGDFTEPVPSWSEATGLTFAFTNTDDWATEAGAFMVIFQGRPQNVGRSFFKGPWRKLTQIDGAAIPPTTPLVIANASLEFPVVQGQNCWVSVNVYRADNRLSSRVILGPGLVAA